MGRIRSIHPGIWTDERFAALSMGARVLIFGLWTEADDRGVFEWKPIGLKMRVFPADGIDVVPLLDELEAANVVMRFELEGKLYGAVRNFCRFQSPRRPSYRYPTTDIVCQYVSSTTSIPDNVRKGRPDGEGVGIGERIPAAAGTTSDYAFESGVIRLKQKDFDRWKTAFSHLDLPAELEGLSAWAEQQGPKWFHAVAGALAKRNREIGVKIEQTKDTPEFKWNGGIEGVV